MPLLDLFTSSSVSTRDTIAINFVWKKLEINLSLLRLRAPFYENPPVKKYIEMLPFVLTFVFC